MFRSRDREVKRLIHHTKQHQLLRNKIRYLRLHASMAHHGLRLMIQIDSLRVRAYPTTKEQLNNQPQAQSTAQHLKHLSLITIHLTPVIITPQLASSHPVIRNLPTHNRMAHVSQFSHNSTPGQLLPHQTHQDLTVTYLRRQLERTQPAKMTRQGLSVGAHRQSGLTAASTHYRHSQLTRQ